MTTIIAKKENVQVQKQTDEYNKLFDSTVADRKGNYELLVNNFYDLITEFYEFGWGLSFHFAPRHKLEGFDASIARHEHWLAHQLELKKGMRVLDVGCGVGGPLIEIARFSEYVSIVSNLVFNIFLPLEPALLELTITDVK
jgi:sterol 24-C-methyltransferase